MSMSTHAVGFRPADAMWNKMKAIYEACEKADVDVPVEVMRFFEDEEPGDKPGKEVDIKEAAKEWNDEYRQGFEIDITKLPKDVKIIRVYNSF